MCLSHLILRRHCFYCFECSVVHVKCSCPVLSCDIIDFRQEGPVLYILNGLNLVFSVAVVMPSRNILDCMHWYSCKLTILCFYSLADWL